MKRCAPVEKDLPPALRLSVERIAGELRAGALSTVLFMGGAGGSLRAGVTENPVRLTRSVKDALTRVTCGGAPVYVWPGGGITFMVDVTRLPANAFGYVPTPALVAPIEFTMRREDYRGARRPSWIEVSHASDVETASGMRRRVAVASHATIPGRWSGESMTRACRPAMLPDGRSAAPAGWADRSRHRAPTGAPPMSGVPSRPRRRASPPSLTSSAPSCRCLRRPVESLRRQGAVARRMWAATSRLARNMLHHADGGGGRCGGRGGPGRDDRRRAARARLCEQWRRHRPASAARRSASPSASWTGPDRPSLFARAAISRGRPRCAASPPAAGAGAASRSASPMR